jgi:hypothetical protein
MDFIEKELLSNSLLRIGEKIQRMHVHSRLKKIISESDDLCKFFHFIAPAIDMPQVFC